MPDDSESSTFCPANRSMPSSIRSGGFLHVEATSGVPARGRHPGSAHCRQFAGRRGVSGLLAVRRSGLRFGSLQLELSLQHWINDFLMAIFFYVIGLEVKRELVKGELRDLRRAALPLAAALGGMIAPAAVYLLLLDGTPGARGWGIPMATDIAFVVGCLAVLGRRIPVSLRVMLLSLAIADDIGAILVIAIGYTAQLDTSALLISGCGIAVIIVCMRLGVHNPGIYLILSAGVWFEVHASGVHATIAGVGPRFLTPSRARVSERRLGRIIETTIHFMQGADWRSSTRRYATSARWSAPPASSISPLRRFETGLHPWVGLCHHAGLRAGQRGSPHRRVRLCGPGRHRRRSGAFDRQTGGNRPVSAGWRSRRGWPNCLPAWAGRPCSAAAFWPASGSPWPFSSPAWPWRARC